MRKKKAAAYLTVIASLLALSIVTPLIINTVSDTIAGRIRASEKETEGFETEEQADDELTALSGEIESEGTGRSDHLSGGSTQSSGGREQGQKDQTIIIDEPYYDEPFYDSSEEEDAANKKVYQDMTEKLMSLSEASQTYRKNFNPVYDELKGGLMNSFISGRENLFYEEIANYCFGHYNTSYQIVKVRFDAMLEDTAESQTVILEFFTAQDLKSERYVPDLKLCTYNKKTQAFVFFSGAGR